MKAIDLFCGIGGFRLALEANDFQTVMSCDIDPFARDVYNDNFDEYPLGDIREIMELPAFDMLTAGFPCQPFSTAGLKEGFSNKDKGTMFFEVYRILKEYSPSMLLLENVKGIVSHDKGNTLRVIKESLESIGYDVHFKVINSLDFGLPQSRERWYCVGFKKGQSSSFQFPNPSKKETPTLKEIIDFSESRKSLMLSEKEKSVIEHHFRNASVCRVEHDSSEYPPNTNRGKYGIFSHQKKDGSIRFHTGDRAKTGIQEWQFACVDTYAPTIIANRVPKLWDLGRKLSLLEAKHIQGLPDDFRFCVSDTQAYKQLGDAVYPCCF